MSRPSWKLRYNSKPMSSNQQRKLHHYREAKIVKEWREAFALLARAEQMPRCERILIDAYQVCKDRRTAYDTGSVFPAIKMAVDGLRDAGVIDDDRGEQVAMICIGAPKIEPDYGEGLELIVYDLSESLQKKSAQKP